MAFCYRPLLYADRSILIAAETVMRTDNARASLGRAQVDGGIAGEECTHLRRGRDQVGDFSELRAR